MNAGQGVFYFSVFCAKLSIIFFLRGAVDCTVGWWCKTTTTMLLIVGVLGLWSILSTIFTCIPVRTWFSLVALATANPDSIHCFPTMSLQIANRALDIGANFCLFLFPVLLIWKLHLTWMRKILFILPFTLFLTTISTSILRNVELELMKPSTDITCSFSRS